MTIDLTTDFLILELSLYKEEKINDIEMIYSLKSQFEQIQFDSYCVSCKRDSTFKEKSKPSHPSIGNRIPIFTDPGDIKMQEEHMHEQIQGTLSLDFQCQRDNKHFYSFYFKITNDKIIKIGQFPSIADLEMHKIQKYQSMLKV